MPLTMLKMAPLAPMPMARVSTAMAAKAGALTRRRSACLISMPSLRTCRRKRFSRAAVLQVTLSEAQVAGHETYKNVVKMTFPKGAALQDPSGLFNSSLDGNARRALDVHEGDKVDEAALKDLIRAAVALNLQGKSKP